MGGGTYLFGAPDVDLGPDPTYLLRSCSDPRPETANSRARASAHRSGAARIKFIMADLKLPLRPPPPPRLRLEPSRSCTRACRWRTSRFTCENTRRLAAMSSSLLKIVFATVTAVTFVASGPTYLLGAPFDDVVAHLPTYPWGRFADNRPPTRQGARTQEPFPAAGKIF